MKVRTFLSVFLPCLVAVFLHPDHLFAASAPPPGACLYALDPTAANAFQIAGAQSVYTACGVVSESSSSSAFQMEGSETLYLENHAQVSVVGGANLTGQTYLYDTISGKDVSAVQTTNPGDPLASISAPTSGTIVGKSPTNYNMNSLPPNDTISPGIYCGGLTIGNTNGATYTFSPGVYIMAGGGLTLNSLAQVSGTGVTVYNTSSAGWGCSSSYNYTPITISGQVTATLSAPTSGSYEGILFFGNRTGCSTVGSCVDQINGGSTAILNGALYFKSDEIEITGSNASGYTMLVADKVYINGNSNFGENGSPFDDITVSVSPSTASLYASQTQQFTATVNNTGNTAVAWTISPTSAGSITSSGLYAAPSSISTQQTVTVTAASQADNTKTATATITLLPPQAPVITWATPAPISYGTALSATQLDATANAAGTFAYSPAAGTVLAPGSQTVSVTFTPTNTAEYTAATASVTLTVNKATPTITWATPTAITYGTALSSTQLDATASVAGTFVYSPATGTVAAAGSQTLSVTFTPTNATDYATATGSVTLTVNKAALTVTASSATVTYGSAIPTITPSYSGFVNGDTAASLTTAPTCTTTYTTTSNPGSYASTCTGAVDANYSISYTAGAVTVNQATPTISISNLPTSGTYGGSFTAAVAYNGNGSPTETISSSTPSVCTVSGLAVSYVGTGACSLTASATATTDFAAVTGSAQSFTVGKAALTITANNASRTYGAANPAFAYTPTGFVNGDTSSVLSGSPGLTTTATASSPAGNYAIVAAQGTLAAANYSFAFVNGTLTVGQASLSITASSAAVTYGSAVPAITPSYAGFVNGDTAASLTAAPTCSTTYTATSNPGSYPSSCLGAVDANYSISYVAGAVTVNKSTSSINWAMPAPIIYGTALGATELDATASVAGAFAYLPAAGTVLAVGNQTLTANFTPTNSTDYTTATASVTLTVNQATPTITWATPAAITYGTALSATQLDATANVAGTFTYSPAAGAVLPSGNQTLNVSFAPTDTTDYMTATASVTLTVNAPISVTISPATATLYSNGTQTFAATVANTSNQAVTWSISPSSAGSISSSGQYTAPASITTQQTVTITATSQASNSATATATVTLMPTTQCATSGYSYARAITIDHTKVPNTDQANFPFLFNTTDPLLAMTSNGGHVTNSNGYDIVFSADPNGQTLLNYEMEEYNPATGQVVAWVRIPTVSHSTDTVIYILYGNASVTTSQQNPTGVWDANYLGVWHVPNGTQLSLADSTNNLNNATNNGAIATAGVIDGGMSTNGSTYATIGTPADLANLAQGNVTFSAWVNTAAAGNGGVIMGKEDPNDSEAGWALETWQNTIYFEGIYSNQYLELSSNATTGDGTWSYVVVTLAGTPTQGGQATVYINGVPSGTASGAGPAGDDSGQTAYLANVSWSWPLQGLSDEFRISNTIRSADWIATEYANQSSPSTFYQLSPEGFAINPISATLYAGQTQQFAAQVLNSCSNSVTWTLSPSGTGTLTQSGLYTAPQTVSATQTVTITAANPSDPAETASATITLLPPVAVTVTPQSVTISDGDQQQQFTASVANAANTAVTWSISPTNAGTIDQTGLYTAPVAITAQQTVTITATSQFDQTTSGSATVTLAPASLPPPICSTNGYSFMRAIVIDHNQVPNTDQANFPFLFNSTDPAFATTANGGHVTNENAYDVIFTSDPAGQNPLNYELEEYNPATGQLIAWIRIPDLSHSADTVIYMFYGNAAISTSQQNPAAVWDPNFMGVWHVPNGTNLSLADSTSNGNNATNDGATAVAGEIDGGMGTSGNTYATIGAPANLANLAHGNATFSGWVNTSGNGMILGKAGFSEGGWALGINNDDDLQLIVYDSEGGGFPATPFPEAGGWTYVAATIAQIPSNPGQGLVTLYVNGVPSATSTMTYGSVDDTPYAAYLDNNDSGDFNDKVFGSINGSNDEFRISNIARSADWIATEYNNQSAPSVFYQLNPENIVGSVPSTAALYASQTEQFYVIAPCSAPAANWSMPAGSPGMLTTSGLYTAPASIPTQQTVTITATNQANGSSIGTSQITLLPPVSVSVSPSTPTLYAPNESLQFTATVSNAIRNGVTWTLSSSSYPGSITGSGLYTSPYFNTPETVTVTATSMQDPTQSASATLTLMPVVVSPSYANIFAGFTQQFSSNIPAVWSIPQGGIGSITQTGLYTPPLNVTSGVSTYVVATAQADPNAVTTAGVYIAPPLVEPVTPAATSLGQGEAQSFDVCFATSATGWGCQSNSQNVAIWSLSPASAGSISSSGVYTAPALVQSQQTVIVTATDAINPSVTSSAVITLVVPTVSVAPQSVTLSEQQQQQFNTVVNNSSNTAVTWTISPASAGSISASGLYTAPASIPTQQIVTVTATLVSNPAISSTANITLIPPSISVSPQSATLVAEEKQQFNAIVINSSNTAITWSISPAGAGSISSSGLYTAPPYISSQQTVTVTATLQSISSITASATVTLSPTQCPASLYNYSRAIVIDHTKVLNSDQANFPLLFSTTDPLLATTANGGHLANPNGYDLIFTSDAAGLNQLPYELEEYNPATGQIIAWINIPNLSYTSDTVIYMFYGNSSVAASQQNAAGVWGTSYAGVWHLPNGTSLSANDSTINANNGAPGAGVAATAGFIDGGASFSGANTAYIALPSSSNSWNFANDVTVSAWIKTAGNGMGVVQLQPGTPLVYLEVGPTTVGGASNNVVAYFRTDDGTFVMANGNTAVNDNNWHNIQAVRSTGNWVNIYVDGRLDSTTPYPDFGPIDASGGGANIGGLGPSYDFSGLIDEVRISNVVRSSDWIATEYNNQNSPSSFSQLYSETYRGLVPATATLYASQSEQFSVTGTCNSSAASWSMPAGSPGTLSPTGLYSAPATIDTQQTVTVTATTLGANSAPLTAAITLMPPVAITVTPGLSSLSADGTQQFTATVTNTTNTAVTWTLDPTGVGSISAGGLYSAPATLNGQQTVNVIATSKADPTQVASATVTLGVATPPVSTISVNPPAATLYAGQTQQFTATVTNTTNAAVTWTISPAGLGSIDSTGLYTAPASLASEQTVTITATSQTNSALSASASVLVAPSCASNGYSYVRQIVIQASKVPNSDQANFPFLFSSTDPLLATIANGGHVTNPSGYDILFTSDAQGLNKLNFEMEEYNPATGQVVAWINIPNLSHTMNTVLYLFYGNSSIATSQQNPAGVWSSNYQGVYHLANAASGTAVDSTANANNGVAQNVVAATGQIDGAGSFDGNSANIQLPQLNLGNVMSASAWFQTRADGVIFGNADATLGNGPDFYNPILYVGADFLLRGGIYNGSAPPLATQAAVNDGNWHLAYFTSDGTTQNLYLDGQLQASAAAGGNESSYYFIGTDYSGGWNQANGSWFYFGGAIDETRVTNNALSADWIAAEYNSQSSPATFYTLSTENTPGVLPNAVTLFPGQSQQFAAPALCGGSLSWSLSADAPGSLTSGGLYTAPSSIASQQTLTVTATSTANPGQSASASVTLMPPISVTVSPTSITLNANQTQQFTALVTNSSNPAVTWSASPLGLGLIDQTGAYIAPSSITTQQTVTVTATSQADPTKSASAMITLAPSVCASTGYGYQRVIVIDHTKVPNTDQINFPFLFDSTDPDLATVDNGGHVANPNGYDIIFSSDPNGQTKLDFEVEQYNPVTGQLVVWMRIPSLSHSSDTVIYVFYGNPAITISQANPAGVWDSNYQAVYHLGNLPSTEIAADSTTYANNAAFNNFTAIPGEIDGSAGLDGVTSYLEIPSTAFPNYPTGVYDNIGINSAQNNPSFDATYSIWFKTNSWGGLLDQTTGDTCTGSFFGYCYSYGPEQPSDTPAGAWGSILDISFDGYLEGRGVGSTAQVYNDNNWHYATVTFENDVNKLYADGQLIATGSGITGYSSSYAYFVGTEDPAPDTSSLDYQPWKYLPGQIDEINVSSTARSGDWIETQFNNQSSPSTFYKFYSPSAIQIAPSTISLYASQSEQFVVPATCDATIAWSLPNGSPGTLTATGLYTAPSVVPSQQTVTVSATSQSNGSSFGSAQVTLLPAPQPITLAASSPSPYQVGTAQSFTATLLDPQGNPQIGVTVNFTVAGPNETVGSATTGTSGTASFTYTGSNNGTDTVQAMASVDGTLLSSNSLTAAWLTPPPAQAPTLILLPQPSPGRGALMGAFTDSNGDLIEPLVVGTAARSFITPAGATQLQLGINDTYYEDNGGAGFVVRVNGVNVTVPPTAMPWNWKTGGLNNNYQYGIGDGTSPVIAASGLAAGQPVTLAYQSGAVSTDYPISTAVGGDGDSSFITGTEIYQGAYFPTLYTTGTAYPQSQPINVFAMLVNASGAPIANTPVTLTVSGANPGQFQATTDATGTASFLYTGAYAGNDNLQAQATLSGQGTLDSDQTTIDWTNYPTPPAVGSLSLTYIATVVNLQYFSAVAKDASGNALPNENVGFYVTGVDNLQNSSNTSNIGQAGFNYYHTQAGTYTVIAADSVGRNVIVTPAYTNTWTIPTGTQSAAGPTITVSIEANTSVTMPNALQLNGTVTDTSGETPTDTWSLVSGPGPVTFANPANPVTTATFTLIGTYVLQLSASDALNNSAAAQFTVTVLAPSVASTAQGWIGSPLYGSTVSGLVPITLAPGLTLTSGTLTYTPANNPNNVTVLNSNVTGSGQIATLDTTALANGSYLIQMQATDTAGSSEYSLILVTVTGNYKPGRVTSTVTDLVVPATGLAINIQRTYDSLNAGSVGDFGYGWNLGINTDLTVDPSGNVTFTLGGQRRTFYFAPQAPPCTIVGCLFPYLFAAFTPEPGAFGTLTDSSPGCPLDIVVPYGSLWDCYQSSGEYDPPGYIYTDPNGTAYNISANGSLNSITDRSGNGLTITPNGITSTTGLNVPFVRDSQNRITQITDPQGNVYSYGYDDNGNLTSVTYPQTANSQTCGGASAPNTSQYIYYPNSQYPDYPAHYYAGGTDARCNPLPTTTYYGPTDADANGNSLAGKLESVTTYANQNTPYTTSYAYNLSTTSTINGVEVANTGVTTVTYPADASGNIGTGTMIYDSLGDLLQSIDPLGNVTTNTYDAKQDLLSTTDPLGHTTSYAYDANGNKTSQTYPATATSTNTTSTTAYNQYAEPTQTTDEDGNTRTFNYDANYNPASVTDSVGTLMSTQFNSNQTMAAGAIGFDITQNPARASQFTYDANGNLASKTDALGRTTSYTYNALGQKVTMVQPVLTGSSASAGTTTYTYDPFGNLTETQAPLGRTTSSTYDGNNNKVSDTDARGNVTTYTYDGLNRLILTAYPDGSTASKTYDFRNNVVTETDQNGHVTQHVYDLSGRQVSVTQAYGTANATTTSYAYDNAGRKTSETDALGHVTNYTYDNASNITAISGVKGNFAYTYDNARNQIAMTDGNGNTTRYQYDARKRLTVTTYPDQTTKTNAYDGPGNLISVTDQAGQQVQYSYDAANQLVNVVQSTQANNSGLQATTIYGYDANGNPITLEDANTHATLQSFDPLSELTQKTLPDGTLAESRTYDNNGNLQTVTHFNGVVTTYSYDQLNRLLSRSTPGEAAVSFTYTPTGKRATMADASGTTSYSYDSMDRLSSKATPEGTLNYSYDAAGNLASMQSADGAVNVGYTWNSLNLLEQVSDSRLGTTSYQYDPARNLLTATYPNQVVSSYSYDQLNRVNGMATGNTGYAYQRGPTGNLTSALELSGRNVQWGYDGIYRLTGESITSDPSKNNGSVSYGLDPVGNRLTEASSLPDIPSGSWGYNSDDEVSSESYDNNGNVIAAGGKTFSYDSENHLMSMGSTVALLYDGDGDRVGKSVNGVVTRYLVDDLNPTGYAQVVEELSGAGAVERTYTYGLQRISEYQPISNVWTASFYGYDGGGNVRQLTNAAGAVTDLYEYDAYGNKWTVSGTTPNSYLYRGEQFDSDLGLYYLRARYYNPLTGRFMSRDQEDGHTWDPKSLHKYLYANGDPVNLLDPTGRGVLFERFILTATIVGVAAYQVFMELDPYDQQQVVAAIGCLGKTAKGYYDLIAYYINRLSNVNLPFSDEPGPPDPIDLWCSWAGH